jgi:hypothetical protein
MPRSRGGWTVDTLRQLMNARFAAVEKAVDRADTAGAARAIKLETETRERFASVNEFRDQQRDLIATFMPRSEFDARIAALEDKINAKNVQIVLSLGAGFVAVVATVWNLAAQYGGG